MIVPLLLLTVVSLTTSNPVSKVWDTDYYSIYFENYGENYGEFVDVVITERNGDVFDHRLYLLTGKLYKNPEIGFLKGIFVIADDYGHGSNLLKFPQNKTIFEGMGDMFYYKFPDWSVYYDRIFEFYRKDGVHKVKIYNETGKLVGELTNGTIVLEKNDPTFVCIVIDDKWSVGFGFIVRDGRYKPIEIGIKNGVAGAWIHKLDTVIFATVYYSFEPGSHPELAKEIYEYYRGYTQPSMFPATLSYTQIGAIVMVVAVAIIFALSLIRSKR